MQRHSIWPAIYPELLKLVQEHTSTIIFVNARRAAERLAKRLGLTRQWLHAVKLGFLHPGSGEYVEFESPYADDLERALGVVRG